MGATWVGVEKAGLALCFRFRRTLARPPGNGYPRIRDRLRDGVHFLYQQGAASRLCRPNLSGLIDILSLESIARFEA